MTRAGVLVRLLAIIAGAGLAAACADAPAEGFDFLETAESRPAGFASTVHSLEIGQERREVIEGPSHWTWRGRGPRSGRLWVGGHASGSEGVSYTLIAEVRRGEEREIVDLARFDGGAPTRRWLDLEADLTRYGGEEIELSINTLDERGEPVGTMSWSAAQLRAPGAGPSRSRSEREPAVNVVLIVVDTLRADHLGAYGYGRATSPEIDDQLAARGVLYERAYAQAPWTLPSVASYLTGRWPGDFLKGEVGSYSVPPDVPLLAERLATRGYETAGFIANWTLHSGNGFGRGFDVFYSPPPSQTSMDLHADDVGMRAARWLRTRTERPFFLYAHFIDPHDPYLSPELVGGRSPYQPEYAGRVTGDWIHGLYSGKLELEQPAADIAHIEALYDSEIHYVDRWVGAVVRAVPAELLPSTLFIFTSDHGEELQDHRGWKHGHTLYEEQIRVPLILRWDGRLPVGSRVQEAVPLLDVVPTALAAVGAPADERLQGENLIAALDAGRPPRRRAILAQHLASGPQRMALVHDARKYVLFDRHSPPRPTDALVGHLWRSDVDRLSREEYYDLRSDPRERHNRVGEPEFAGQRKIFAEPIHRRLDRQGDGLRLLTSGLESGATADVTIEVEPPPSEWSSYFLGSQDRVELVGNRLSVHFVGDGTVKGIRLHTRPDARLQRIDGGSQRVYLGAEAGSMNVPGESRAIAKLSASWPVDVGRPGLYLWSPRLDVLQLRPSDVDEETVKRLQALGYLE